MAGSDGVIRWGMIGCGDVTERKSGPAYARVPGSCLAGVTSRRIEAARDYASRHHVPRVFESAEALASDPGIDAIYVATPPSSHSALARLALEAGKPCCVEKPIAPCAKEAEQLVHAFEAAGLPLFIAYYRRTLPRFQAVRAWIKQGHIGEVRHIHWSLFRFADPPGYYHKRHWRIDPAEAPGGYFDDLACHGLDLFDYLLGPISMVQGVTRQQGSPASVPDAIAASWSHASGATGTGSWHFAASERRDRVEIAGSDGFIRFSVFDEIDIELKTPSNFDCRSIANPDPIQLHHVEAMMNQLTGGLEHPALGRDALRTAQVCERILQGDTGRISS